MFDNLQKKSDGVDDIFADTDPNSASKNIGQNFRNQINNQPPAMSSGNGLKNEKISNSSLYDDEKKSSGILKKMFIFIIVIALIGAGAYFVYSQILLPKSMQNKQALEQTNQQNVNQEESETNEEQNNNREPEGSTVVDENILIDENEATSSDDIMGDEPSPEDVLKNLDSDNDGLSDYDETYTYKTNLYNPDSDGDGLSDSEEVLIIGTDPLNQDTDGDTYLDGQEMNSGYNPLGGGVIDTSLFKNLEMFKQKFSNLVEKFSL
ncbi:MAG TPA: hypothetical protein PK686_03195 [bacterium]|nr:hypothetical protein [bacterium]HPV65658.1 hypothetical protein [bacterium]